MAAQVEGGLVPPPLFARIRGQIHPSVMAGLVRDDRILGGFAGPNKFERHHEDVTVYAMEPPAKRIRKRGGRPPKPPHEARRHRIVVWVNAREQARFLINAAAAGLTGADYARARLCAAAPDDASREDGVLAANDDLSALDDPLAPSVSFELVDALSRIGVALHRLAPVILASGHVPGEFSPLLRRLDTLLDRVLPP